MKVKPPFPNGLREMRFRKNISQTDLSIRTRIHISSLSRFERGYRCPSLRQRGRIARVLGCLPEEIFPQGESRDESTTPGK
jgi:transcriptional regulator with XRE-family HTH domain